MRIDYGIQINHRGLKHLEPVIKGWGKAISTYCENWSDKDQDAPYYYNERPNVSLLAAGAWESGAVALEEYVTTKERRGPSTTVRASRGAGNRRHLASVLRQGRETRILTPVWESSGESRNKMATIRVKSAAI
jgi:hypothetical protein